MKILKMSKIDETNLKKLESEAVVRRCMVAHCCQLKFEHLHYDITLKFQSEIKNETNS